MEVCLLNSVEIIKFGIFNYFLLFHIPLDYVLTFGFPKIFPVQHTDYIFLGKHFLKNKCSIYLTPNKFLC